MPSSPLRSAPDRSDPGFNRRLSSDRARIEQHIGSGRLHVMPGNGAVIVRANHRPFEGVIENGPYLRIGLCLGSGAPLAQRIGTSRLEGVWRPGSVAITPPDRSGVARCGKVAMIGLAVAPAAMGRLGQIDAGRLDALAGKFHDDALLSSVLTAMFYEADVHGASTAFFEHGLALVFERIGELPGSSRLKRVVHPLSQARFDRVRAYVESSLETDISVADMAAVAGMDPSGFTRALRARIGAAPYAWLTRLRMERAKRLLASGLPVTCVACSLGYANIGKFAKAFGRVTGCTPSQWRRETGLEAVPLRLEECDRPR